MEMSNRTLSEGKKEKSRGELGDFTYCVLGSCPNIVMLLVSGSTAQGEMTEYSDVDGTAFVKIDREDQLKEYKDRFGSLAQEKFNRSTENKFYEPHWSLFLYPEEAIRDVDIFGKFNGGLPADFTMFNLKENSLLVWGNDLRNEFPVEYRPDIIDEWASFAPSYHLGRAKKLAERGNRVKACYALSRSILQAARVVVWKDAKCTSSSYEDIVSAFQSLDESETLPVWALEARKKNFDVSLEEVRKKLNLSDRFVRGINC